MPHVYIFSTVQGLYDSSYSQLFHYHNSRAFPSSSGSNSSISAHCYLASKNNLIRVVFDICHMHHFVILNPEFFNKGNIKRKSILKTPKGKFFLGLMKMEYSHRCVKAKLTRNCLKYHLSQLS